MKTIRCKASLIVLTLVFTCIVTSYSQNPSPEWMNKLPTKKGFIFGAGVGKSSNMSMAKDKARMDAITDLTQNYSGKFETFAAKCDTVLGPDNAIRQIVTTFKVNQNATLTGVEIAETVVENEGGGYVIYMLLKLDVRNDVKTLQSEVDENSTLRKQLNKAGLLSELKDF